jgi:hypothetical protein
MWLEVSGTRNREVPHDDTGMMVAEVIAKHKILQVQTLPVERQDLNVRGAAEMRRQRLFNLWLVDSSSH